LLGPGDLDALALGVGHLEGEGPGSRLGALLPAEGGPVPKAVNPEDGDEGLQGRVVALDPRPALVHEHLKAGGAGEVGHAVPPCAQVLQGGREEAVRSC